MGLDMRRACRGPCSCLTKDEQRAIRNHRSTDVRVTGLARCGVGAESACALGRGFEVYLHLPTPQPGDDAQQEALYLRIAYGLPPAGRTLTVFRLLLEANLSVYAQDQAQLGLNDNGVIVLIVRVPLDDDVDGAWICDLLAHYAEHGRYWNNNIFVAHDEMFEGIATGNYLWLRA